LHPPPRDVILAEVLRECETKGLACPVQDKKHVPDKQWSLACLSTLNPDHEMFKKGFCYKVFKAKQDPQDTSNCVNNQDGFFSNLKTPTKKRSQQKKADIFTPSPEKKSCGQIQELQQQIADLNISGDKLEEYYGAYKQMKSGH
jgi:hypothetical protein